MCEAKYIIREEGEKAILGVKRKDKLRWVTEETLKLFKDRREAKVKGDRSRVQILKAVFTSNHIDMKRDFTIVNVKR